MKIGDSVILIEEINMWGKIYEKGHKFKIYGDSDYRGWNLIDKDGNKIDETRFIQDKYIIDIKEERKKKLINLIKKLNLI